MNVSANGLCKLLTITYSHQRVFVCDILNCSQSLLIWSESQHVDRILKSVKNFYYAKCANVWEWLVPRGQSSTSGGGWMRWGEGMVHLFNLRRAAERTCNGHENHTPTWKTKMINNKNKNNCWTYYLTYVSLSAINFFAFWSYYIFCHVTEKRQR